MKQKFAFLLILACALPLHAAWHVARHIAIGGEGGWDYINADAAARRLYVSHSDAVVVIDLNDHKVVGTIPAQGVHGIVTDDAMHRGFISNGRSSTVTIFDTQTLKPTAEVKATGVRCLALSNMEPELYAVRRTRFPFMDWFDGSVISGLEGAAKPDRRIFEILLTRYRLDPQRTVFTDDSRANVEAARALGIHALLYTSPQQLRADFTGLGLLPAQSVPQPAPSAEAVAVTRPSGSADD